MAWSSHTENIHSRHPKSAGSSATVPCRKTLNQPIGKSQGNHTKQYRRQHALIPVINSYLQALPLPHETMIPHKWRTPLVQWQILSLVQPMKWWKGPEIWLRQLRKAMTMQKQRGSANSETKRTKRRSEEEDYSPTPTTNSITKMQKEEYLIKNACYSVTKYYLCKQNNKRSLLGRKQRNQVACSFPNRYLFSFTNKVTYLFSISCILRIILHCKAVGVVLLIA